MPVVNDILQVKVDYVNRTDDTAVNVFFYIVEAGSEDPEVFYPDFMIDFQASVIPAIQAMLDLESFVNQVEIINLFDDTELYTDGNRFNGASAFEALAPFTSVGFRTNRVRRDIRRGFKRLPFITEEFNDSGQLNPAGGGKYDNVESALAYTIIGDTGSLLCPPVIVKRIKYVTPSGRDGYRLPENQSEAVVFNADEWFVTDLTTQNSRKTT